MEPLYRYDLDALGTSRDAVAARHAGLFALRPPVLERETPGAPRDGDADATDVAPAWGDTDARALAQGGGAAREWEVALIRKRPGYPPFNRVVVGRSPASDLVVRVGSVSRLHAHVHVAGPNVTHLEDRGSRNGTTRNGVALAPFAPVPVAAGDVPRRRRGTTARPRRALRIPAVARTGWLTARAVLSAVSTTSPRPG